MAKAGVEPEEKKGRLDGFGTAAREMMYGMAARDTHRLALKPPGTLEHFFIPTTHGRPIGGSHPTTSRFTPHFAFCCLADFAMKKENAAGERQDRRVGFKISRISVLPQRP